MNSCERLINDGTVIHVPDDMIVIPVGMYEKNNIVETVYIPKTIRKIGRHAFYGCRNLKHIIIEEGVEMLGTHCFAALPSLESIELPDSIRKVEGYVFERDTALKWVSLPENLESLGKGMFLKCTSLHEIAVPNNTRRIFDEAFSGCTALKTIHFQSEIVKLEKRTFAGCSALVTISFPMRLIIDTDDVFEGCESLDPFIIKDGILKKYVGKSDTIVIPESVREIEPWAFAWHSFLKSVEIPASVRKIGQSAFTYCESLKCVIIHNDCTIGRHCFYHCSSLSTLIIPETCTAIGPGAFRGCSKLADRFGFVIINHILFYYRSIMRLHDVFIPDSVFEISEGAFQYDFNIRIVYIGEKVRKIRKNAFAACLNLNRFEYSGTAESWKKLIESSEGFGCRKGVVLENGAMYISKTPE